MGEALHEIVREAEGTRCRIYAPVGAHRDLLAYLVRRLLENGANSSFVNQIVDKDLDPRAIAADPIAAVEALRPDPEPGDPPPGGDLFAPRRNSAGWNVNEPASVSALIAARARLAPPPLARRRRGAGAAGDRTRPTPPTPSATVTEATPEAVAAALAAAPAGFADWSARPAAERARVLRAAADEYERNVAELTALATREAGKTLADAIAEVREAVDFLRYYADAGRGGRPAGRRAACIVCISPWNFPLAIFTGQVAAASAPATR